MTEEDDLLKIKKKRLHEPVTPLQHKVLNSLYEFSQGERRPFSYVGHGDGRMVRPTFRLSQGTTETSNMRKTDA